MRHINRLDFKIIYRKKMAERFLFPLTDRDYYAGKVTFQAFEIIPPKISLLEGGLLGKKINLESVNEDNKDEVEEVSKSLSQNGNFAFVGKTEKKALDKCTLFLPQSITFQDGVAFDEFALGRVGGTAEAAVNSGASFINVASQGAKQSINALTDIFQATASDDVARLAATRIARVGSEEVQQGVSSALRVTTNPNKRLLFKEVNIREFSFTFKLIPTTPDEAKMITNIIKFFRTELYPDDSIRVNTQGASIPIGYKFPNQFVITFLHNDKKIAHRILPSYLVSMQTVYNPTGMGFFEDGNFTETDITLNFRESRTLSKQEVRDENY
jgi:hypothetical protein